MTQDAFNNTRFGFGMTATYNGKTYPIASVDFEEMLIGITGEIEDSESDDTVTWKRCENIDSVQ